MAIQLHESIVGTLEQTLAFLNGATPDDAQKVHGVLSFFNQPMPGEAPMPAPSDPIGLCQMMLDEAKAELEMVRSGQMPGGHDPAHMPPPGGDPGHMPPPGGHDPAHMPPPGGDPGHMPPPGGDPGHMPPPGHDPGMMGGEPGHHEGGPDNAPGPEWWAMAEEMIGRLPEALQPAFSGTLEMMKQIEGAFGTGDWRQGAEAGIRAHENAIVTLEQTKAFLGTAPEHSGTVAEVLHFFDAPEHGPGAAPAPEPGTMDAMALADKGIEDSRMEIERLQHALSTNTPPGPPPAH